MDQLSTIDATGRDQATDSQGMPLHRLETLLSDMENEPQWRESANKCADYYDHKQSSAERIERSAKTGEPMSTINLIQRTINGALGQEAKARLDWKIDPDTDAFADVAAMLNERMHEAQREARTDMAMSEAYSSMLRTGIGWIEVSRTPDPLAYPYRVSAVHRNEVWWDWRAKLADKSDARWVCRQRWVDLDDAQESMPQFRDVLEVGCNSGPITDAMARTILTSDRFESLHQTRRGFSRTEEEWLDNSSRRRVRFYSVYYKKPITATSLVVGTKRVKLNTRNPIHVALVQRGAGRVMTGPSYQIRHAMFAGPFRLFDVPVKGRRFPLVPFVCYSADDDFSPYGLVHGMIEPQDEFNERRSRLLWLLKAKQVFVDDDALNTKYNNFADLALEVMRPDALFVLNSERKNATGLRVESNTQLQAEQVNVMMDAKQLIQDVPGLYNALLGSGSDGAKSGVALNSLVEQSVTSLGETSDNYRMSRREVGDLLMGLIAEDHMDPDMKVQVGTGAKRRTVVLNTTDGQGLPINPVEDAQVRVGLGDVPTTPAYRGQQQVFLSQAIQSVGNDPVARAVLVPALLESSDLEHRAEYAKWMRQQAGVPEPGDMDDEAAEQAEAAKQQQMAQQAAAAQAAMQAEVAGKQADAEFKTAQARKLNVEAAEAEQRLQSQSALRAAEATTAKTMSAAELDQARIAEIAARIEAAAREPDDSDIDDALAEAAGRPSSSPRGAPAPAMV